MEENTSRGNNFSGEALQPPPAGSQNGAVKMAQ